MAELAQYNDDDHPVEPDIRPHLSALEGGGETSEPKSGHLHSVPNEENGDSDNAGGAEATDSGRHLQAVPDLPEETAGGGLYKDGEGEQGGRFGAIRQRAQNFRSRAGSLASNKWLIGGLAGGSTVIIGLFVLLILLLGSLKIPHLAQHITEYEFARVVRQSTQTSENLTEERLALDAADDGVFAKYKLKYQNLREQTWGKFDRFRPNQTIKNMKTKGTLNLAYDNKPTITGRYRLRGITIGNTTYLTREQGFSRYIPALGDVIDFENQVSLAKDVRPALTESLKANDIGPIIRGRIAKQIRKELGISLVAWTASRFNGENDKEARITETQQAYEKINDPNVDDAKTPDIKNAEEKAKQAEKQDMSDPVKTQQTIDANGVAPDVAKTIEDNVKPTTFQTGVSYLNSTFGIALAGCTIYDGSLTQSGPTINSQTASQEKAYYYLASAADQQKEGQTNAEAVGATNARLGDITQTNPEIRANGGDVDTSSSISSEASAAGDLSILDVVFGGSFGGVIDTLAGPGCKFLLNPVVASAGAVVGALAGVLSGGGSETVAEGVDVASQSIVQRLVTNITERFSGKFASKEAAKETIGQFNAKARAVIGDTTKSAVKVGGLTILAKLIVLDKAHIANSGTEQGPDAVHMADSGGNLVGGGIEQRQYYGRPLTREEAGVDQEANKASVVYENKSRSTFERYLALDNADSMLSHTGMLMASTIQHSPFSSLLTLGGKLFDPVSSLNHLFGSLVTPRSFAAATYSAAHDDYGNVQWGYSAQEMALLKNDPTYRSHLENQSILDASGQEDAIDAKYGKCFDGSEKIGDMLANGDIVRDKDGNVEPDKGLCSPNNLGVNNNEFGPQMVFRWRVANSYNNQLDQMFDEQQVGNTDTTQVSGDSAAVPGDTQSVAKEILNNTNITYQFSAKEDVQLAADGKPGTNGAPIDIRALQIVAALGKNHKVVVSAYESHGQGHSAGSDHYTGHAVDIASIDGVVAYKNITDFWNEFKDYADGAVFLQGDCSGAKAAPTGMNRLPGDTCNHQHISLR